MTGGRVRLNARISPPPALATWTTSAIMRCEGDDCPCARDPFAHPPVLMMLNPESGTYERARLRCVAVWAAGSAAHRAGQICGQPGTHQVADVVVCEHHYRRIREWMNDRDQRDVIDAAEKVRAVNREAARLDHRRAIEQAVRHAELRAEAAQQEKERLREIARLQIELDRERVRAGEAARAEVSVVYFVMRESDGLIKIGTSRNLAKRLVPIKKENGPLKLAATAGGDHKQETALHRKFAALRAEGEWFRPELPLLEHVYALMKERPLEPAPGLPPIMARREIGSMIWKIKIAPAREMQRAKDVAREAAREARRLAREQRAAAATVPV